MAFLLSPYPNDALTDEEEEAMLSDGLLWYLTGLGSSSNRTEQTQVYRETKNTH